MRTAADDNNEYVSRRVFSLLEEYSSSNWVFIEPGGNFGDQLIYLGMHKLANIANVNYESIRFDDFMKHDYPADTVLYIHGGGGFVPWWSGKPIEILKKATSTHRGVVIQGPQTYHSDPSFLQEHVVEPCSRHVCRRLVVMAREQQSFETIKPMLLDLADVQCDHDTALNLIASDLSEWSAPYKRRRHTLYALRHDKEAPRDVCDNNLFRLTVDPVGYAASFQQWVGLHHSCAHLITNRLHSSIVGSILGIDTTLIRNNYRKNRSVWEYSLKEKGVVWADHIPETLLSRAGARVSGFFPDSSYTRDVASRALHRFVYQTSSFRYPSSG